MYSLPAPGGPETLVLRDVPEPTPGPREVRVRVASCAVNYPDVLIIDDRYQTNDLALKHGADAGIVGPRGPVDKSSARTFTDLLKGACGSPGADVIFDPVGGDYAEPALRAIGWEGRYLVVGFTAGIPRMPLNLALLKSCQIVGVFWGAFADRDPTHNRANIDTLLDLYRRGRIKPFISERLPLERAGEAIARLAQRRALGKIVVMVS